MGRLYTNDCLAGNNKCLSLHGLVRVNNNEDIHLFSESDRLQTIQRRKKLINIQNQLIDKILSIGDLIFLGTPAW